MINPRKSIFEYRISKLLLPVLFILCFPAVGQVYLKQSVRGVVRDKLSKAPLPGATVVLVNSNPLIGTVSGINGEYKLDNVPIGNQQVSVSFMGFATYTSDIFTVASGKESIVNVDLMETLLSASEVEIKSNYNKCEAINKMATVSVRSFSVEETNRIAGSYGDPARMAANFAGVTSGIDNRNDIVVRGNSPSGMIWRLDEMEIPNPNHFAAVGTTGGPVTVLNENLLTNSDFYSGAFPVEFGNTVAGVFDLNMRTGNNEKHEFWGQIGWNGFEFGAEGPFSKKSPASYLIAYRYSLLSIINKLGIKMKVVPEYQDINFKVSIPTKSFGTFSIIGMGGVSYIEMFDSRLPIADWTFPEYGQDLSNGSQLGVLGISNTCFVKSDLRLKTLLYITGSQVTTALDTFNIIFRKPAKWAGEKSTEVKLSVATSLLKKFSTKNSLESGLHADYYWMNFADSIRMRGGNFRVNTNSQEGMLFLRGFGQWQHRFNDFISATTGLNFQFLTFNTSYSIEPRFGLNWVINDKHALNFGIGLFSQMPQRVIYFARALLPDGSYVQTNRNLDFTRSFQAAVNYSFLVWRDFRFRSELYYQHLYNTPVKSTIPEFSVINQGHEFFVDRQYADSLVNLGSGDNYGLELTFEKFFSNNYFFLVTASLFNSTYVGFDNIKRSSGFDANFAMNAAGGYEFKVGKKKLGVISLGLRATWAGGNPYIPFDEEQTVETRQTVMDWKNSFQAKYPDYKRLSLRFGLARNRPGYSISFLLDLQYRTNYTNVFPQQIDVLTGKVYTFYDMFFFPMGTWRVQF